MDTGAGAVCPLRLDPLGEGHDCPALAGEWCRSRTVPRAVVEVDAARQAGIEAADGPHDVDPLEVGPIVLLEDRLALDRVLVRTGGPELVARVGVPRGRRVGVVVRDLAAADDHVVGQDAADGLGEPDADRLVRHLELVPGLGVAGPDLGQRLLDEVQRARPRRRPGSTSGRGRARSCCSTSGSSTRTTSPAGGPSGAG